MHQLHLQHGCVQSSRKRRRPASAFRIAGRLSARTYVGFGAGRKFLTGLGLGVVLQLVACEQWHLSVNADGLVFISVIDGDDHSRDRFRMRTRQSDGLTHVIDLPPSGHLTLGPLTDGVLELTLLLPAGCSVSGSNPRTLEVRAGEAVRVEFDVRCSR